MHKIFSLYLPAIFFVILTLFTHAKTSNTEQEFNKMQFLPFPLSSSFGGSGIAGTHSAEYHHTNAATIMQGNSHKATGFYFFNKDTKIYGGSITNRKDIPLGLTWIWNGVQHYRALSIAGTIVPNKWFIGATIRNFTNEKQFFSLESEFSPQLGWLYKFSENLFLGFTGDRINKQLIYGLGFYYSLKKVLNFQGDVHFIQNKWNFRGGVEWTTQDHFSLRLGYSWPDSFYRAGISILGNPLLLDYTWIQEQGHSFSLRIHSNY